MNRRLIIRLLVSFITAWLCLSMALGAFAHDDEAYIELNITRAQPGMPVEIRGEGFEPGVTTTIMLMLAGSDRPQVLGTATTDSNGNLAQIVLIPVDMVDGAYEVRVADTHHVATADVSIVHAASGDDEGGQRGEDEPLLAPLPEHSATNETGPPIAIPPSAAPASTIPPTLLLSSGLALIVLVGGLVIISRRSR